MNPSAEYNFKPKDFFILTDVADGTSPPATNVTKYDIKHQEMNGYMRNT